LQNPHIKKDHWQFFVGYAVHAAFSIASGTA